MHVPRIAHLSSIVLAATLSWACNPDAVTSPDPTSVQLVRGGGKPGGTDGGATITLLPGLSSNYSTANDVNDAGVVVGVSEDASGIRRPVYWTRAASGWTVTQLPATGGGDALVINEDGVIAGRVGGQIMAWVPGPGGYQPHVLGAGSTDMDIDGAGSVVTGLAVWRRTGSTWTLEQLPSGPAGTSAYGINDAGVVVGRIPDGNGERAVYWTFAGGAWSGPTRLADTDMRASAARKVNGAGVVVGIGSLCDGNGGAGACPGALLWRSLSSGREVILASNAPATAEGTDINDAGVLVGTSGSRGFWATSAADVRYLEPARGHRITSALALNDNKQVVGFSARTTAAYAALWTLP